MLFGWERDEDHIKMILKQCYREGVDLPEWLANEPVLLDGLELWYRAFNQLSTCRQVGMGMGPIPWTAIHLYAEINEFVGTQREDLFQFIAALDKYFLDYHIKKTSKGTKK